MATFIGTNANETITPTVVTPGVVARPGGSKPSNAADTIEARGGNDTIDSGGGDDTVLGQLGNDIIRLGAGNDLATWNVGHGNDTVDGGTGTDAVQFFGDDNDASVTLSNNTGRLRFTHAGESSNLVNVEAVRFSAGQGADTIVINDLSATDVSSILIEGGVDTITIHGTGGADTVQIGFDFVHGLSAQIDFPGQANIGGVTVSLGGGNDVVTDTGGKTAALLGAGNDRFIYRQSSGLDFVDGQSGTDTVEILSLGLIQDCNVFAAGSSATGFHAMVSATGQHGVVSNRFEMNGVEALVINLSGGVDVTIGDLSQTHLTGPINVIGSASRDFVDAGASTNAIVFTGNAGFDRFNGGHANDTFVLARPRSSTGGGVSFSGGDGDDRLQLVDTGTLARISISQDVEILQFVSGTSAVTLPDHDIGDRGIKRVLGGTGNDRLNVQGDSIDLSDVTFSSWGASDMIVLKGTSAASTIKGSAQRDIINGALGADLMTGLAGDDLYVVENANDTVSEFGGSGIDTVQSSISFVLYDTDRVKGAVENLTLTDVTNINGSGNGLANTIIGNSGNNALNGRGGGDTLQGLAGNDRYFVDSTADKIIETSGTDNVNTSVSYVLGAGVSVETLRTIDAAATTAINLTGNNLANTVIGNAGSNVVNGGAGSDRLTGNAGNDFFAFNTVLNAATNVDTITDFVVVNDTMRLENSVFRGLAAGVLNPDAFHIGSAAADAEDRIIYNSTTGALIFDSNGSAAGGATQFAKLATGLALTNADFVVV